MSKKSYTENIKKIHDEWKKTYPSFVERRNNEQLASNKLDRSFGLGYHRTITDGNARHAQLNASPSIPPGSRPIKDLMQAVASPEVGTSSPEDLHAENTNRFVKAASSKPQASSRSSKLQALSSKLK